MSLTLEPFNDHRFELANALAGELRARAAALLGQRRVEAFSFTPFGYFEDHKIGPLNTDAVSFIRKRYDDLDVAVFGCGDRSDNGWLDWTQGVLDLQQLDPATDVCLNMLSAAGEHIPLPEHGGSPRQFLGVSLDQIRRIARDKLALLLASGRRKGLPITLVVRAGCCNAVVCDQAAANAALAELRGATPTAP